MDKTILLKTQLNEAAKLAKQAEIRYKRLAVILLDNFVEIQLRCIFKGRLYFDGLLWQYQKKKYKQKQRNKINSYYEELLKACVKEKIINSDHKKLLLFCHGVRNNIYHNIDEEELLVKIAIKILYKIIKEKQPKWGNGYHSTLILPAGSDPFEIKKSNNDAFGNNTNVKEEWDYFFKTYFNILDKREKSIQCLLGDYIKNKILEIKSNIKFITDDGFSQVFSYAKGWGFNEYCLHFSFLNSNKSKIEELKEDPKSFKRKYRILLKDYVKNWKIINSSKLINFQSISKKIITLSVPKALEEFIKIKKELDMVYKAFESASIQLDKEIQFQIDLARGK